jgi:6-phosphogluconolactonase
MAIDPAGKFLYVTNSSATFPYANVTGFTVDANSGTLTPIAGSPFPSGTETDAIVIAP